MSVKAAVLRDGAAVQICALVKGNRCELRRFLESLSRDMKARVWALLVRTAENGLYNPDLFKHERGKIYAFRKRGVRLYSFYGRAVGSKRRVVLTHGAMKQRARARPEDLDKAERLMKEFEAGGSTYVSG